MASDFHIVQCMSRVMKGMKIRDTSLSQGHSNQNKTMCEAWRHGAAWYKSHGTARIKEYQKGMIGQRKPDSEESHLSLCN